MKIVDRETVVIHVNRIKSRNIKFIDDEFPPNKSALCI